MNPSDLGWLPPALAFALLCMFLALLTGAWIVGQRTRQRTLTDLATLFSGKIVRSGRFWSVNDEVHWQHRGVPVRFRFGHVDCRRHAPAGSFELVFETGGHFDCQVWMQPLEEIPHDRLPNDFDSARLRDACDVLAGDPEFDRRFVTLAHDVTGARTFLTPAVRAVLIHLAERIASWGESGSYFFLHVNGGSAILARRAMCVECDQQVEFVQIGLSLVEAMHLSSAGSEVKGR
jgi:hypothetical protein